MRNPSLLCGLVITLMTPIPRAQELRWVDAASLTIEGRAFADSATPWERLPARAEQIVREPVWRLSQDSAGIAVGFVSDAGRILLRYELAKPQLSMPHMPATGVSGFDLYAVHDGTWRQVAAARPSANQAEVELVSGMPRERRRFFLYLPLYNGVRQLDIGVPSDCELTPAAARKARPVVFYGTSITQGACASRPGMCHVAILGRRLDLPVVNLGFSGQGRMDLEIADLLGEIDAAAFVIDCLPNMNEAMVRERAASFLRRLRAARPEVPVVVVEDRTRPLGSFVPAIREAQELARSALREALDTLTEEDLGGAMLLVPGDSLLGDDGEATVDGSHPTDLGFVRQADALEPALREALRLSTPRRR